MRSFFGEIIKLRVIVKYVFKVSGFSVASNIDRIIGIDYKDIIQFVDNNSLFCRLVDNNGICTVVFYA